MKTLLISVAAFAALALALPAAAQSDDVIVDGQIITGDFDADGATDVAVTDFATGRVAVGFRTSQSGFAWKSSRALPFGAFGNFNGGIFVGSGGTRPGFPGGVSVAVADVNNDSTGDYVLTSVTHNAIAVLYGARSRDEAFTRSEIHQVGAGPAAVAAAQLDATTPGLELAVPLLAELQPRTVQVRPQNGWLVNTAALDSFNGVQASGFRDFAILAPAANTSGGRHAGHLCGYVFGTELPNAAGELTTLRIARDGESAAAFTATYAESWEQLIVANMRGPSAPGQFVLWSKGTGSFMIGTTTTPGGGSSVAMEKIVIQIEGIENISEIGGPGRDRLAVVHDSGARLTVYGWDPVSGQFRAVQSIAAPAGRRFASIGKMQGGGLFAKMSDGTFAMHLFDAGGLLQPVAQGVLPVMPAHGGHATVVLYTNDPLSGQGFEFESFAAGDWAREAVFAGGEIDAVTEIFQSTASGLGSASPAELDPASNPGAAAYAQGNQFGDPSSSLFFAGGVNAGGNAAVQISPAPGTYASVMRVSFIPAQPGTSVVYRVNGQAWQQAGAGGFFVAADALVEYYGQAAGGALGTIQSANYDIELGFAADVNDDFLPDQIAAALGLDPGGTDGDGDGVTDIDEVLNGSNPRSAASRPASLTTKFPPALSIDALVLPPAATGTLNDAPAAQAKYTMFLADGTPLRSRVDVVDGRGAFAADASLIPRAKAGAPGLSEFQRGMIAEVELQGTDPKARGASMLGMAFAPGFMLPQLPPGTPSESEIAQWVTDTSAVSRSLKAGGVAGSWTGPVLINADTTLAVAAFTAWARQRLTAAGVTDIRFAWDHRGAPERTAHEIAHTMQQLRLLEHSGEPASAPYDLAAVARGLYNSVTTNPAFQPLRIAAREIIRRDTDSDRKLVLARTYNAAQALLNFFDAGKLDAFYADAITAAPAELAGLRTQLLALPQRRSVRQVRGRLFALVDRTQWAVETESGEIIALMDERHVARSVDGGIMLERLPARLSDPTGNTIYTGSANGGVWKTTSFLTVEPLLPNEPLPHGTHSAAVLLSITSIETDLRAGIKDSDGDRLDDAFELQFLNHLGASFWDDTDDDGFGNGEEYFFLTDPANPASRPSGTPSFPRNVLTTSAEGAMTLSWEGRASANYAVDESTDLTKWTASPVRPVQTAPGHYEWTTPSAAVRGFYQLRVEFE